MKKIYTKEKKWCLYCHENKINHKKYYGITCQKPEKRWQNGNGYKTKYFYNAIQKYGWDGFIHTIILKNLSLNEANKYEMEYIKKYHTCIYDTEYCNGYNATFGGDGALGYKHTEETKKKFKHRHRIVTDETKKKISESEKGKVLSKETKDKLSQIQTGRKLTEEWKKHISEHHKKAISEGNMIVDYSGMIEYNTQNQRKIDCYNMYGDLIDTFESINDASRQLNVPATNISKVLQDKYTQCNKMYFCDHDTNVDKDYIIHRVCKSPIYVLDENKNKTLYYSINEASEILNISSRIIKNICNGKRDSINGLKFCYA